MGQGVAPLGLIAMSGTEEMAAKIDHYLVDWAHKGGYDWDTFLIDCECPRFSSGDGKGLIKSTIRGKDLFILVDVGIMISSIRCSIRKTACLRMITIRI